MKITLKVIIKAIISYLILSISLFRFSVRFRDDREGTGREITTLVPSRRDARDGTTTLFPVPFPDGTGTPDGVVPVPGEAYSLIKIRRIKEIKRLVRGNF